MPAAGQSGPPQPWSRSPMSPSSAVGLGPQPGLGLERAEGLGGPTSACNTVGPKYTAPRSGRDRGLFKRVVSPWTASSARATVWASWMLGAPGLTIWAEGGSPGLNRHLDRPFRCPQRTNPGGMVYGKRRSERHMAPGMQPCLVLWRRMVVAPTRMAPSIGARREADSAQLRSGADDG